MLNQVAELSVLGYEMEDVNSTITLIVENEETHLRFIEVNNEKVR